MVTTQERRREWISGEVRIDMDWILLGVA